MSVFSPPQSCHSVEFSLISDPTAVQLARRLVVEWFRHWSLDEALIEDARLVASEIVTNAIKAKGPTVRMRIRWTPPHAYIEVYDQDPNPPVRQAADPSATGGRGLLLVEAYARRWNHYPAETAKVVWAEF
ncbi:ATP-binding protein [Actinomadura macrotermitis]|nr:ATP-binding protein [Actinomadura macrotermitis]